jgi:glycerol-3-phosphate dehydrogenase
VSTKVHSQHDQSKHKKVDIFIIGGGVNGCGIARDAAGRGLSVRLAEQGDIAQGTSSASSKLFHGGLRYLEYYEFGLVRKALEEREVLLNAMPHISYPMRFIMPHHQGLRPQWLIRMGLFLYDHLGKRKWLPSSRQINLHKHIAGSTLKSSYSHGFEYSDCWVHDSRLVVLNAKDAAQRGAIIMTRTQVINAHRIGNEWLITTLNVNSNITHQFRAKKLVNASGPWIQKVISEQLKVPTQHKIRLVRGSHIVVPKLYDHPHPYILQGHDGRIVFLIPFEGDYTLIGTTDVDHASSPQSATCSDKEAEYICQFVNEYLHTNISPNSIVWRFSGVRPLFDDGAGSASAATRDYVLELQGHDTAPLLNVYGGKITTYRKLAEATMKKLYANATNHNWTAGVPLPGGDLAVDGVPKLINDLRNTYHYLDQKWAFRLATTYGTETFKLLGECHSITELGQNFGVNLTEKEVHWLIEHEFALTAEDILWRRTKLGLRFTKEQQQGLQHWLNQKQVPTCH